MNKCIPMLLILSGCVTTPSYREKASTSFASEAMLAEKYMLTNISPNGSYPGTVIASPSRTHPNYYYEWVRDEALTMSVVLDMAEAHGDVGFHTFLPYLFNYAKRSAHDQQLPTLTGLGEPKFQVNGSPYNGPWARPQNDGPALRALTMIRFANDLLARGKKTYVRKVLYSGKLPPQSIIKKDLEYVAHNWQRPCFDLWEETWGYQFYTLDVQRAALIQGAALAKRLGDPGAAQFYLQQARAIEHRLGQFWDPKHGYIIATMGEHGSPKKKLDVAVILAALHVNRPDDPFGVTDPRILSTAEKLREEFSKEYQINRLPKYAKLGTAIGRYPDDHYNGYINSPDTRGNPWILATAAFAQLYYQSADAFRREGVIQISKTNEAFFKSLGPDVASMVTGEPLLLKKGSPEFARVLVALKRGGDRYMQTILFHQGSGGHLSEEINRDTGIMQGARDLTWSYAAFLTAYWARPSWSGF